MSLQGTRNTVIVLFARDVWRPTKHELTEKSYRKYIHLCLRLTTIYRNKWIQIPVCCVRYQ